MRKLPEWFSEVEFAAYFVAYSNSALNPIIYCGFNANFRQGLVSLLTCRHASTGRIYHRRNWKGMTGGTRETTVGCSGPEPAVLLEFNSIKRNRLDHKFSMTSSHSGRVLMTCSNKDLRQNNLNDFGSDNTCKNYNGGEQSQLKGGTGHSCPNINNAVYNNHHLRPNDVGLTRHHDGKLGARASNSWSSNSGAAVGCGCCKSTTTTTSPLHHHHQMYDLNHLKEDINNDIREDVL
ncbi:putative QRFP-like peptide receptor-like 2 [Homarus americanus]|uniref:Putative QRFP-like peptide receptor-like 2 n=1 Tax=Homarus americanus TaxID=6706 RepID=A0A8J5MQR2_HOMAM|nr:putative QRFP-like peptide receptor-like 2 [Homarus americanus]